MTSLSQYQMIGRTRAFASAKVHQPTFVGTRALIVGEEISRSAMEIMLRCRADLGRLDVRQKSHNDLETRADIEIQKMAIETIVREFPGHRIIAEEIFDRGLLPDKDSSFVWTIDPVDGTNCLAMNAEYEKGKRSQLLPGFVQFGFQMSFMIKWYPVFSIFAAPLLDINGDGYSIFEAFCDLPKAYLNGRKIEFSAGDKLKGTTAMISLDGTGFEDQLRSFITDRIKFREVLPRGVCSGSEFCMLIARPDALGSYNLKISEMISIWDLVPGAHIVEKSGGCVRTIGEDLVFPINFGQMGADHKLIPIVAGSAGSVRKICRITERFIFDEFVYTPAGQAGIKRILAGRAEKE